MESKFICILKSTHFCIISARLCGLPSQEWIRRLGALASELLAKVTNAFGKGLFLKSLCSLHHKAAKLRPLPRPLLGPCFRETET